MKEVTYYRCEVCDRDYKTRDSAETCERRPTHPYPNHLQIGKLYNVLEDDEVHTARLVKIELSRHTWYCLFDDGSYVEFVDVFDNDREQY